MKSITSDKDHKLTFEIIDDEEVEIKNCLGEIIATIRVETALKDIEVDRVGWASIPTDASFFVNFTVNKKECGVGSSWATAYVNLPSFGDTCPHGLSWYEEKESDNLNHPAGSLSIDCKICCPNRKENASVPSIWHV